MGTKGIAGRFGGTSKDGLVKAGRIGKLFGTDGGVILNLYDTFPDEYDTEEPLWVFIDSLAVPLFTERFERRGNSGALVRFADMDTTQRAEELIGLDFYLFDGEDDREDGELYMEDLEGYSAVICEEGSGAEIEGVIAAFLDSDFNPLFSVDCAGREVLIPASDDLLESVDQKKRLVYFILPEGLLDLNE